MGRLVMKGVLLLGIGAAVLGAPVIAANITVTYDASGRVVSVSYDDGSQVDYTYDQADNRTATNQTAN